MSKVKYAFTVKGTTADGNKAKMSGHLLADDDYPSSAFDAAVSCCQKLAPDLVVDLSVGGNVVLQKLKKS